MNKITPDHIISVLKEKIDQNISIEDLSVEYLGRKGVVSTFMRSIKELPETERKEAGAEAQALKQHVVELLTPPEKENSEQNVDFSVPAKDLNLGTIHPISEMIYEISSIFQRLSFEVVEGNELVSDYDNFESVNFDTHHPARDTHDTLYTSEDTLLRTHTSAMQVKEMKRRFENKQVPMRFVMPGKTYRRESDPTHSIMFHQIEGVLVDTQTSFSDLKGILEYLCRELFGDSVETRFRPHYFPFTEPSAEMDIRRKSSDTEGRHSEWLELLGCGMIHPNVLQHAGINSRTYRGWAFGMAVERPLMIRHQISDLRLLFENSPHFLNQFQSL